MKSRIQRLKNKVNHKISFLKFAHEHRIEIQPKYRYVGIIFILIAYYLLGSSTVFFYEVSDKYPVFEIFICHFTILSLLFSIFIFFKENRKYKMKEKKLVLIRGAVACLTYFAYFASKISTDIIDNSLLFSIDALIVPIIMYMFFRHLIPPLSIFGLIMGYSGVGIIYSYDIAFNASVGGLIGFLSGVGLAFIIVITSYMVKNDSPLIIGFYQGLIGVVFSFLGLLLTSGFKWELLYLGDLVSIIIQAIFFSMALFLFLDAFYYVEAHVIAALGYSLTLYIILLDAIIRNELINLPTIIGMFLTTAGGILVVIDSFKQDKKHRKHYSSD